jgi:hypothetical protein
MSRGRNGRKRREYSSELKEEAVQVLVDGHSAEPSGHFGLGVALFDDEFRRLTLEFPTVPLLLRHNEHVPFGGHIACVFHTPRVHRR